MNTKAQLLKRLIKEEVRRVLKEASFKPVVGVKVWGSNSNNVLKDFIKQNQYQAEFEPEYGYWYITSPSGENIDAFAKRLETDLKALNLKPIIDVQKSGTDIKDGQYRFKSINGNSKLTYGSTVVSQGDWEPNRNVYVMQHSSFNGERSFPSGQAVIDYFKKNRIVDNPKKYDDGPASIYDYE